MKYLIIDKKQRGEMGKSLDIPTGSARLLEELKERNIECDFIFNDNLEFTEGNEASDDICLLGIQYDK